MRLPRGKIEGRSAGSKTLKDCEQNYLDNDLLRQAKERAFSKLLPSPLIAARDRYTQALHHVQGCRQRMTRSARFVLAQPAASLNFPPPQPR